MKILWIHQYFATPKGWGAARTYEFARRFCAAGHAVDVVCGAGYDASLAGAAGGSVGVDGLRVYVGGAGYRPQMGFVRRVGSFLMFMAYALWHVLRKGGRYDVVIASSGPLTVAVPALLGRWLRRTPYVFEVIDVWPDSAIAAGVLRNPLLKWLSFKVEALAYKHAAAVVTCSTGMTERVERKLRSSLVHYCESSLVGNTEGGETDENRQSAGAVGRVPTNERMNSRTNELLGVSRQGAKMQRGEKRVVTISNSCDLAQFVTDGEQRRRTRARLGVRDDQTVVLYTGAMGVSNAVEDLVAAVKGTRDEERIVWWFAGSGPEEWKLKEIPRQGAKTQRDDFVEVAGVSAWKKGEPSALLADPRFRFFGSLPKAAVVELYLAADVNVVTFMHAPLFYENSPNKFFDGIAAGLPAVFNRTTWLEPWLKEYGCGIVCTRPDVGAEMAQQLKRLAADGGLRQRMGAGARRLAEEVFSRDKLAAEYLEVLGKGQ